MPSCHLMTLDDEKSGKHYECIYCHWLHTLNDDNSHMFIFHQDLKKTPVISRQKNFLPWWSSLAELVGTYIYGKLGKMDNI